MREQAYERVVEWASERVSRQARVSEWVGEKASE